MGSGGGCGNGSDCRGGNGGGILWIKCSGNLVLKAYSGIYCNGLGGNTMMDGGGSGGSLLIECCGFLDISKKAHIQAIGGQNVACSVISEFALESQSDSNANIVKIRHRRHSISGSGGRSRSKRSRIYRKMKSMKSHRSRLQMEEDGSVIVGGGKGGNGRIRIKKMLDEDGNGSLYNMEEMDSISAVVQPRPYTGLHLTQHAVNPGFLSPQNSPESIHVNDV